MIEMRELKDIKRHNRMRSQAKNKKANNKQHHLNKRQYNSLVNKLKRSETKKFNKLQHQHKHHAVHLKHSMYNGVFIQLRQRVQKRKRVNRKLNRGNNRNTHFKSDKSKQSLSHSTLKHRLNSSPSVQRGVAKIFKGFKHGKRKSAALRVMASKKKKVSHLKNNRKSAQKSKLPLNARVINNASFAQVDSTRYFNKYKKYTLKKAKVHFHPSYK
mmetsp:Transcript_45415/g.38252  ORF Transcript_45415/g.38252 Transcript_45415/m.38252 type:complete len:214 (+) Transcript_45415:293-934(+)